MVAKIFLTVVGLTYLGLALWCTFSPDVTSDKVGFDLKGGSGKSEFMTVYGGLEFGMALVFFMAWINKDATNFALLACIAVHGSLVLFRTLAFFRFSDIGGLTVNLAIGEWVIFLASLGIWIGNWYANKP